MQKKKGILEEIEREEREFEERKRAIEMALAALEKKELLFRY
jgi:hypothetical protein